MYGLVSLIVPGVERVEEIGVNEVVWIEDDKDFIPFGEVAHSVFKGGDLRMEG